MNLEGTVALVTGANRGLGRHLAEQLVGRGAAKVYAAARDPESVDLEGVVPVRLDVTDPDQIEAAARIASDATLLVNNAGILTHADFVSGPMAEIRAELDVHFWGPVLTTRAFAPVLESNGGGAILNVLSGLSWIHLQGFGAYSAGKAAAWALSDVTRQELAPRGIAVTALHVGYMDTDMIADVDAPKADPAAIAAIALDGLERGAWEVIADEGSRRIKAGLSLPSDELYASLEG